MMTRLRGERFTLWLAAFVTLGILASTALVPHPESVVQDRFSLLAILVVGVVARHWGLRAGIVAAFAGFLMIGGLTYPSGFVPGVDTEAYFDLAIFLVVALVAGANTGQLREREKAAIEKEDAMELVNRLGSRMISNLAAPEVVDGVLNELGDALGSEFAITLFIDEEGGLAPTRSQTAELLERRPQIGEAASYVIEHRVAVGGPFIMTRAGKPVPGFTNPRLAGLPTAEGSMVLPLVSGSGVEGVLFIGKRMDGNVYSPQNAQVVVMAAGLLSLFFERQRLQRVATRVAALQQADELKTALVSSVSHELRSPLAAVAATITGLLSEGGTLGGDWVREELEAAAEDLQTLDRRIEEVLDISRLEASSWAPSLEWHDLADLCSAVMEDVPEQVRCRITCVLPPGLPPARFDFVQMARAIHHILENALQYSPPSSQVLLGGERDGQRYTVWVEDYGPGIPDDEKRAVFGKFFRGQAARTQPHGTGLGLAIAAEIVRQHGGTLVAEDAEPHGARIVVSLPIDPGER